MTASQVQSDGFTGLERRVHEELTKMGIEFVTHPKIRVTMFGKRRRLTPDIFVPAENLLIEVNGCFVHGCEECFGSQGDAHKRWKDSVRLEALRRAGYDVDVIWGHELRFA